VTIGARRVGKAVKIWVADTGRGLSPTDQARAFDAFESRGPSAGAGLGLALVERFVKLHHGWVRMDSHEGKGATITCFLPEPVAAAKTAPASEEAPAAKTDAKATKKPARSRAKAATKGEDPTSRPQAAE
jgi:K+-sensing histidine kinase KdpD